LEELLVSNEDWTEYLVGYEKQIFDDKIFSVNDFF